MKCFWNCNQKNDVTTLEFLWTIAEDITLSHSSSTLLTFSNHRPTCRRLESLFVPSSILKWVFILFVYITEIAFATHWKHITSSYLLIKFHFLPAHFHHSAQKSPLPIMFPPFFSSSTHHFPPQKYHFSRRNSAVSGARTGWCCTATVTRSWSAASMRPAPAARGEVPGGCWPSPSTMDGGNFLKMVNIPGLVN